MRTEADRARSRWARLLWVHAALCAALAGWLALRMQPVELPGAHGERIPCVSYSPFYRPGESPLDPRASIPPAQVRADLAALAPMSDCVRIYAVSQGLEAVPAIAAELGMKVLLGAWIGADDALNRLQIERAAALANAHPQTVRALIVGNEVLLRREQAPQALRSLIERARALTAVPVTYADVWEFWVRHPELAEVVDFVTVHILPFWEDQPVGIDRAVEHVAAIRAHVAQRFAKPILIGETGWPAAGRQREAAAPGRVNQARFTRELMLRASREGWDYNLIEAIDQPWKRVLEGTVGGHWGILGTGLEPKFALDGPVAERPGWGPVPAAALAGAVLLAGLAAVRGGVLRSVAFAAVGLWAGAALALNWEHAGLAWRDPREWLVLGAVTLLGPAWLALAALRAGAGSRLLAGLQLALLFCAALGALWLAADPRYRDFPVWMYAGVAPAMLLLGRRAGTPADASRICALVIAIAGIARWAMEPANPQAIGWLALCAALALGGWAPREQQQR